MTDDMALDIDDAELIPIRTLAERTGVNPVTIRAWERRYGLLKPRRTPKGHRLYNEADVALVQEIQRWLARGVSIGKVKDLLEQDQAPVLADTEPGDVTAGDGDDAVWQEFLQRASAAAGALNTHQLDAVINEVTGVYPMGIAADRFIQPLLSRLETNARINFGANAALAFSQSLLRSRLATRLYHAGKSARGAVLLIVPVPGEDHSVMGQALALAAASAGYRVNWIDAGLPLNELSYALERLGGGAAVIYADNHLSAPVLDTDLPRLADSVGAPVYLAGGFQEFHRERLEALPLPTLPAAIDKAVGALTKQFAVHSDSDPRG